jgi:hypothetical protein
MALKTHPGADDFNNECTQWVLLMMGPSTEAAMMIHG